MKTKTIGAVLALMAALTMFAASSASAAATIGNSCTGNRAEGEATVIQLQNANPSMPAVIPSKGVITSWTFTVIPIPPGELSMILKVFKPTGAPGAYQVVAESSPSPVAGGANTFSARIPVEAGDLIGDTGIAPITSFASYPVWCEKTGQAGDVMGVFKGNPGVGSTATTEGQATEFAVPITAKVEPDADGDGYGDETQDQCPTNAATQAPCPAPPAPITLSATGAAKKGSVVVTLTASAQASVTVAGTVKVGGSNVKLSGGTQVVAPGTLAKFTVVFPAKLKKQLKKTPTSKKLTLSLSATAPGATSTALTVKVKGQKKPTHHKG